MAYRIVADGVGGPEVLTREDIEVGEPGEGQLRLRHTAVGLNYLDTYFRSGLYPWPPNAEPVPGGEAVGIVEAVGAGVDGFAEGDRVGYTLPVGAYTSHRIVPADRMMHIPEGVSEEVAACSILKGLTAHYLLTRTFPVKAEHTVLFQAAAGGVGLIAGQWLKHIGATAIGTAGGPEKCKLAAEHGYSHVIDYNDKDFVAEVDALTKGEKCHVVFDGVGQDTYPKSLDCLRRLGMFVTFGNASGPIKDFDLKDIASRGGLFATRPSLFNYIVTREELDEGASALFGLIADGTIKVPVNQIYPLAEAAEAHRALQTRKTTGSTVLIP